MLLRALLFASAVVLAVAPAAHATDAVPPVPPVPPTPPVAPLRPLEVEEAAAAEAWRELGHGLKEMREGMRGAHAHAANENKDEDDEDVDAELERQRGEEDGDTGVNVNVNVGSDDETNPLAMLNAMPLDVRDKLDGDQIRDILMAAQESAQVEDHSDPEAIIVPSGFFFTVILIVGMLQLARARRDRQLHETLRLMIQDGVEIPPALLVPHKPKVNDLRRGVLLVTSGAGLSAFLAVAEDDGAWAFGLVPFFLGAGYLLSWFLARFEQARHDQSSS